MRAAVSIAVCVLAACAVGSALAQSVSMAGSLGSRALLVIDGKPKQLAVGNTVDGVHLLAVTSNDATVEVGGKRVVLLMGGAQVNLGGAASDGSGSKIVLAAGSGGHYFTSGTINGKNVRFLVDTGATTIAIAQAEADRIGLNYKSGARGYGSTANGAVATYQVTIATVQVGDVQVFNVEATVLPGAMPYVLLGNSFLDRFQMRRESDKLTLEKRY